MKDGFLVQVVYLLPNESRLKLKYTQGKAILGHPLMALLSK